MNRRLDKAIYILGQTAIAFLLLALVGVGVGLFFDAHPRTWWPMFVPGGIAVGLALAMFALIILEAIIND